MGRGFCVSHEWNADPSKININDPKVEQGENGIVQKFRLEQCTQYIYEDNASLQPVASLIVSLQNNSPLNASYHINRHADFHH